MRALLKNIIEILDGTPAEYGKNQRGQSLVEMTMIVPLLVLLVVGIVEIGWFANNYLILLEVTRVGARRGTVLLGDNSPLAWNNAASLIVGLEPTTPDEDVTRTNIRNACATQLESDLGFYNQIICVMLGSLDPLPLRNEAVTGEVEIDDIVVSAFAVQLIDNGPGGDYDINSNSTTSYDPGFQTIVVGRYPSNANECTVAPDDTTLTKIERDPFDYIEDDAFTFSDPPDNLPLEIPGGRDVGLERQRGFVWIGQHQVDNPLVSCIGSEWSVRDIERLLNFDMDPVENPVTFPLTNDEAEFLPPTEGLVLVEMFWQHELLLNIPVFSPVYNVFGGQTTPISVWAVFPVPALEPNIQFTVDP